MRKKLVYIKNTNIFSYSEKPPYSPPILFPEYPFKEKKLDQSNIVYKEIRNLLYEMDLDKVNFNTKHWDPFRNLINPGDMVVLKPNMVMHENENKKF